MTTKRKSKTPKNTKTTAKKPKATKNTVSDGLVGKALPRLKLFTTDGQTVDLPKDLQNQWTVLYFYPRDNTPGCTRQACTYRDERARFKSKGIQVLGVSADSLESHEKFTNKYSLNFPLISDPDKKLSEALGVYRKKSLYGREYMGINRDSFLIDPNGKIRKVWRKVDPVKSISLTYEAALEEKGKTK